MQERNCWEEPSKREKKKNLLKQVSRRPKKKLRRFNLKFIVNLCCFLP